MADLHRNVFEGVGQGTLKSESGQPLSPPEGWAFLPAGDAGLTRRVKSKGPVWVVQKPHRNRLISKGVWAPADHILAARQEVEAKRATPAYARARERELARRQAAQQRYAGEFFDQVLAFLNFHPRYEQQARQMAEQITRHATPVGSGTVARTRRIPVDQRARAAVMAWMRHKTTAYDSMTVPRIKGRRREIRKKLAQESLMLLEAYRQGRDPDLHCPLKRALAQG